MLYFDTVDQELDDTTDIHDHDSSQVVLTPLGARPKMSLADMTVSSEAHTIPSEEEVRCVVQT